MQNYNSKFKNSLQERCCALSIKVINLCDKLPQKRSAWVIADQLIRSTTSIGANLVESRASSSRLEFKKFNEIALKSANETLYWLYLLKDTSLTTTSLEPLIDETEQIAKMIASGVIKIKNNKF